MNFQFFKPNEPLAHFELSGAQGIDLLQRIGTNEIKSAPEEKPFGCMFLDDRGKIQSVFVIIKRSSESMDIFVPIGEDDSWKKRFLDLLDHYTFAEQYDLKEIDTKSRSDLSFSTEDERIQSLGPSIDQEITPQSNPLEIGLLSFVSQQKGCYPGQEVVEKIIAIGEPAKRLVKIQFTDSVDSEQTELYAPDQKDRPIGKLTSISKESPYALALAKKIDAKEGKKVRSQGDIEGSIVEVCKFR